MISETPLQMAERHVAEGKQHIARQEALITRLAQDGHHAMLIEARQFLTVMQQLQRQFEMSLEERRTKAVRHFPTNPLERRH